MGIAWVRSLRDFEFKLLSNLASYKLWILATATWLLARDALSEYFWIILAALVISERFAEKLLGLGAFTGRMAARCPRHAAADDALTTGSAQGTGERGV